MANSSTSGGGSRADIRGSSSTDSQRIQLASDDRMVHSFIKKQKFK
jgi:hypothetical protein